MAFLYGRERDLSTVGLALSRALSGDGSLVLVTGEPGIGKSAFGREVALRAAAAGMRVLAGRCWESGGAAPYWPWIQIFRSLGTTPFEAHARADGGDALQQRFQLFDAAARALTRAAETQPLFLSIDDIHAADLPSLLLLLFIGRQVAGGPLFILATAREGEPRRAPEIAEVIGKLGREGEVLSLARLGRDEVAAWMAAETNGTTASADPASAAAELFRVTEGNPLFVREMLRVAGRGARGGATDGIRAALDEHLGRASLETRVVLEAAAVLGRDFGSRDLAAVVAAPHDEVLGSLREACELGVLEAVERERFQFTHVLLRDRLDELLAPGRRSALQWAAGLVGEAHDADASRVANHLLDGADAGDAAHAASSALRAAERALQGLAFETAVELAERGRAVLAGDVSLLACRLDIACAEGLMRCGAVPAGRARCVRAAAVAQELGSAEAQARAALTYGSELTGTRSVNAELVGLLERAQTALGPADSPLTAKIAARLATALIPPGSPAEVDRVRDLALTAIAMARRIGDAETLLYALDHGRTTLGYMVTGDERFALIREAVTLAQLLDQRLTLLKIGPAYAVGLLERGLRREADAALAAMVELHAALDHPPGRWRLPMLRAGFALWDGDLEAAERLGNEASTLAERAGTTAAQFEHANQRLALAIAGRAPSSIAPHAPSILAMLERNAFSGTHRAWILAATGRTDEARQQLRDAMTIQQGVPTLLIATEACVLLDDREAAGLIEEQLRARSLGLPFFWGGVGAYAFGPTPRALGELARLLGRPVEARRCFEDAIALCRRIGAEPFLALSLASLERLDAEAAAPACGAPPPPPPLPPRTITLRREGDVWAIGGGAGPTFRLRHSKGLGYLKELLIHPGQDLHVLALVGLDHAGDAGPVLDARAKTAYKQRLEDLQDEIAEADGFGDGPRASRARAEIEALGGQLAGAMGLGGRDRRAASHVERARINVQRRLKDALASIDQADAELGRYLSATVKTGTYCTFVPL